MIVKDVSNSGGRVHQFWKSVSVSLIASVAMSYGASSAVAGTPKASDAAYYLKPAPHTGEIVSDITYRVIATHGPGMDDNVWQIPATGTYTILNSDSPGVIKWTVSVRMDGKMTIQDAEGDLVSCLQRERHSL
jgi:hypothetical protein